jgi:hypothetical protein
MSGEDRTREEQEDRRYAAIAIAIAACVLRPCADHGDILLSIEYADIQDAYRYGNRMLGAGHLKKFFKSRRQMTDCIRAAVVEYAITRCPICDPTPPH